jgi:hypothetical protein
MSGVVALVGLLVAPGLFAQAPPPDANPSPIKPTFEEWVVLILRGKECGYGSTITTRVETPTGPQFVTEHEEEFVVKRLGSNMKIIEKYKVTEDADGGVLSFDQVTAGGGSNIESTGVRDGDDLVVTGRGQTQRYHLPRLAALGPEKVRELSDAVPLKPGQTFTFNTFESDYPQAVVVEKGTVVGQESRDVRGKYGTLWKISNESSMTPGLVSISWVDDLGNDVEALSVIPGIGELHEYVTNRFECMKQPEGAEIFAPTMIHPDRALPAPAEQAQAVYRLTLIDLSRKLDLWNEGEQRILSSGPGTCDLEVTARTFTAQDATYMLPHADTPELHPYLQASTYLEVNSPEIQALAPQAVGGQKNPVLAARAIETFVRGYITKKDYNVGFGSAEETAKSREGDCTEHAVLCAALGRAVGLPTRCVVGFGYLQTGDELYQPPAGADAGPDTGVFGFHMWAEAWIGPDKWMPMDAALNGFDVGHIAIAKTALAEINPLADLNAPILQLMENLKIEIIKTVPRSQVSPPAPPVPTPAPVSPARPAPPAQPIID